jgi:hypothetical protein
MDDNAPAIQEFYAGRPHYSDSGWDGVSQPTVSFSGGNLLSVDSWSSAPAGSNAPFSVLAVLRSTSTQPQDAAIAGWWGWSGAGYTWADIKASNGQQVADLTRTYGVAVSQMYTGPTDLGTGAHVIIWRYAPSDQTLKIMVDGAPSSSTQLPAIPDAGPLPLIIGAKNLLATGLFQGNLSELVVTPTTVSDEDAQNFTEYAQNTWAGLPAQGSANPCVNADGQQASSDVRCDDQDDKTVGDHCSAGSCVGTTPPAGSPGELSPIAWYHAGRSEISLTDGLVSTWFDRSGHHNDVLESFYNARPAFVSDGWNGKPTLRFSTPNVLRRGGWSDVPKGTSAAFTVLAVVRSAAAQTAPIVGFWDDVAGERVRAGYKSVNSDSALDLMRIDNVNPTQEFTGSSPVGTAPHVLAFRYSPEVAKLTIDGATVTTTLPNALGPLYLDDFFIGTDSGISNQFFNGDISELALVEGSICDSAVANFVKYAASEWGGFTPNISSPTDCSAACPCKIDPDDLSDVKDDDCDGMPDVLEQTLGLDPSNPNDRNADPDGDGVRSVDELRAGGNPLVADTDPTGGTLLVGKDLDGDGRPYEIDNCPDDVNSDQLDTDGDGKGDACDNDPLGTGTALPTRRMIVVADASNNYAIMQSGSSDANRLAADQHGLFPWGSSFRVLGVPAAGTVEVSEYFNASTGHHAYAVTDDDRSTLTADGFSEVGSVGWLGTAALPFGDAVQVRHYTKGTAAARQDAVTTNAQEGIQFITAGYTEVASLGFGITEEGHVSKPIGVVRYKSPAGTTLHLAGAAPADYESEDYQFGVLPEPNGWTYPLYRYYDAAGREAFSSNGVNGTGLATAGYIEQGYLGFVYNMSTAPTLESLVRLVRVRRGTDYAITVHADELDQLHADGFGEDTTLGYVVRRPAKVVATNTCPAAVDALTNIFNAGTRDGQPTLYGNVLALGALNQAVSLSRIANGIVTTPAETTLAANWAATDPQSRRLMLAQAGRVLAVSAPERANLLGQFAYLDPGNGSTPVDYSHTAAVFHTLAAGTNGDINGGLLGDGRSAVRIRAPQCQGVTYADTYGTSQEAASAVTIREGEVSTSCTHGETPICTSTVGTVKPRLYGITRLAARSPIQAVNDYADVHSVPRAAGSNPNDPLVDQVGIPLIGIDVGPCSDACSELAGERCVNNRCRAYPIIPQGASVSFSAVNAWDVKAPTLRIIDPNAPSTQAPVELKPEISVALSDQPNPTWSCDPNPVTVDAGISTLPRSCDNVHPTCPDGCWTPDEFETCLESAHSATHSYRNCTKGGPYCQEDPTCLLRNGTCVRSLEDNPDDIQVDPYAPLASEPFVDTVRATIDVTPGHFYTPQLINYNGSYYRLGDQGPDQGGEGRTIHLCVRGSSSTDPDCEPPPDPNLAACELANLPNCGGTVGGIWNVPPRSLAYCEANSDLNNPQVSPCAETPFDFRSDTQVSGLPLLFYVEDPDTEVNIQTRLIGIHCIDETGGDALGNDDLYVNFVGSSTTAGVYANTYKQSINSDEKHYPAFAFDVRTRIREATPSRMFLWWNEDDWSTGWQWVGALAVGGVGGGGGYVASNGGALAALGSAAGGLAGAVTTFLAIMAVNNPDDVIGASGYEMTVSDVMSRGQRLHAGGIQGVSPFDLLEANNVNVRQLNVSEHPSVDLQMYASNGEAQDATCANDSACGSGRNCYLGVCVLDSWQDRSAPTNYAADVGDMAGTIEERKYRPSDSGAKYDTFLSTSIRAIPHP